MSTSNGVKTKFVTIGLIQNKVSGDIAANVAKTEKMVRQAAKRGAQIICLGELFQTPYFPQREGEKKDKYAETVPGPTSLLMQNLAKELGVVLIVPIYEKAKNGKYWNTAIVFDNNGKMMGKYDKIHIPHDPGFYEKEYFEAGRNGYKIFKTKFGTFAVLICFDQWFPEAAREARLAGAEIIFYPTAIADIIGYKHKNDWHDAWETSMRGHAIANSVVVAAVNRVGVEGRSRFFFFFFCFRCLGQSVKARFQGKRRGCGAKSGPGIQHLPFRRLGIFAQPPSRYLQNFNFQQVNQQIQKTTERRPLRRRKKSVGANMIKAIIFDADGVIISSEELWDYGQTEFLGRRGLTYDREKTKHHLTGKSLSDGIKVLMEHYGFSGNPDALVEERYQIMEEIYHKVEFMPGFLDFFNKAKPYYKTAVATSSHLGLFSIADKKLGISKLFNNHVYFLKDVNNISKPAPDIFLYAAKKLQTPPAECLVIEDAPAGITAAKNAGMRVVALSTTHRRGLLNDADVIVDSFDQINLSQF